MGRSTGASSIGFWLGGAAAIAVTVVVAVAIMRVASRRFTITQEPAAVGEATPDVAGVTARLAAGGVQLTRRLPAAAFALAGGQTLDGRLAPGPFEAELVVSFDPGTARRGRIGAWLAGGSLGIERKGRVVASAEAGDETVTVASDEVFFPSRLNTFTYRYRASGDGPAALRALWWPEGSPEGLPLPADSGRLHGDEADAGFALVQRFRCAECHASADAALQEAFTAGRAPILGRVGARARPSWIRSWITDPHAFRPRTVMPALFGDDADPQEIEDLTHFLVSMGGPLDEGAGPPSADLIETGRLAYHRVGCFACHGPLDGSGGPPAAAPIGPVAQKTTAKELAAFLLDPVSLRPDGRMPSMRLTDLEAEALATCLIAADPAPAAGTFAIDPARVERGRRLFAARGCAECHDLGPDRTPVASVLEAPALERVAQAPASGCLAASPPPGTADFRLDAGERHAIRACLESIAQERCDDVPHRALAATLDRLNCLACHTWAGAGGPTPTTAPWFATLTDLDLGDEGRLPPDLTDVGARLNPAWLHAVLADGGTARPYMAARMPQFGAANVEALPALFAAAAGASLDPAAEPAFSDDLAESGRRLVGAAGFNCIQCHTIAGRDSTELPGPDLVQLVERLRYPFFASWLNDPKRLRPGTRMPTFFSEGRSGLTEEQGGDAARQIAAIWSYLSQGDFLPLPDGIEGPGGYELEVGDEPIVFRTFMTEAGPRAIACGFPEQIHCAFDADRCVLALVWTGRFLNAEPAWAARGGSPADPEQPPVWTAPAGPVFAARLHEGSAATPCAAHMRGYRFDDQRRPVFLYDLEAGDERIAVTEQPLPHKSAGSPVLRRRFTLHGQPGVHVLVTLPDHRLVEPPAAWEAAGESTAEIVLDEHGMAEFTMALSW